MQYIFYQVSLRFLPATLIVLSHTVHLKSKSLHQKAGLELSSGLLKPFLFFAS